MPFRSSKSKCPDVDAITSQTRAYARARGTSTYPDVSTALASYLEGSKVCPKPRAYQATGDTRANGTGYTGLYQGYAPYGHDNYQGFDAARPIPRRGERRSDFWKNEGEVGEDIVDVDTLASSTGHTEPTHVARETKAGKGRGWIFYVCLAVAMGVFLGLLGYFVPKYCRSHHKQKPLGKEKVNEDGVLTTIRHGPRYKVTTRIPLDQFTGTDTLEKRALPTIQALPNIHDAGKTTTTTTTTTFTATLRDDLIIVPHADFPTYNSRQFVTKTIVATTSILATVTEHTGRPTSYSNCCPTITSYYPKYFHCPSPTLQPHLTLQCPYMPFKTSVPGDLKTTTTTSTMTLPCSAQPSNCRLPNGDFCIPETTYIANPIACPTTCPPLSTESVIITHVVLAHPHGDYVCVVDADTGDLRDATQDEKYDIAGGKGWYEWDKHVERPAKGVFRLLGELGRKGLRKAGKMLGLNKKIKNVAGVQVKDDGDHEE